MDTLRARRDKTLEKERARCSSIAVAIDEAREAIGRS
jgi:hypothetical protein